MPFNKISRRIKASKELLIASPTLEVPVSPKEAHILSNQIAIMEALEYVMITTIN